MRARGRRSVTRPFRKLRQGIRARPPLLPSLSLWRQCAIASAFSSMALSPPRTPPGVRAPIEGAGASPAAGAQLAISNRAEPLRWGARTTAGPQPGQLDGCAAHQHLRPAVKPRLAGPSLAWGHGSGR